MDKKGIEFEFEQATNNMYLFLAMSSNNVRDGEVNGINGHFGGKKI